MPYFQPSFFPKINPAQINKLAALENLITKLVQQYKEQSIDKLTAAKIALLNDAIHKFITCAIELFKNNATKPTIYEADLTFMAVAFRQVDTLYSMFWQYYFSEERMRKDDNLTKAHSATLVQYSQNLLAIGKILKGIKNKKTQSALSYVTGIICITFCELAHINHILKDDVQGVYYCTRAYDWLPYLKDDTPGFAVNIPEYLIPYQVNGQGYKRYLKYTLNFSLYLSHFKQGYIKQARRFLSIALNSLDYIQNGANTAALQTILKLCEDNKKHAALKWTEHLENYYKRLDTKLLAPRGKIMFEINKNIISDLPAKIKAEIFKEITEYLKTVDLGAMTYNIDADCGHLHLTWDKTVPLTLTDLKIALSKIQSAEILQNHTLVVKDFAKYKKPVIMRLIYDLKEVFERKKIIPTFALSTETVKELSEKLPQLTLESPAPIPSRTKKHAASPLTTLAEPKTAPTVKPALTAKNLGFRSQLESDVPVVTLSGLTVPADIYFVHGLTLSEKDDNDKVKPFLPGYQATMNNGNIVAPRSKGFRLVKKQESGLPYLTFKITDPMHDLRIVLEHEETIKDDKGRGKHLFRAGRAVFH